ncbi:MAG: GNAT family N-acetyltransferase [Ardenticatenaceae bacterium]|nr:GNAT family N-acetyltransferase [Ardenticatenaceae bacterium]MCB9443337.1 GNAT family N-acetyltransferase [Ardenticatenaceae bacterium]
MVVTIPAGTRPFSGPRPINLNRDVSQVINLLELVFGHRLGGNENHLFNSEAGLSQPAFLWRLNPATNKLALGYVWEENGRIIGNATLLTTRTPGRYLVVNVAVHPDFRRRGIARDLMESLTSLVQKRGGHKILLQVVKDNTAALDLYRSLNYHTIGSMTTWRCASQRLRQLEPALPTQTEPFIQELSRQEWWQAYQLDITALATDLNWPEPLPEDSYKRGLWRQFENFMNGRRSEIWVTKDRHQLTGLAGIWSEWGRAHQIALRVHPAWKGELERPLLAKAIRRISYLSVRNVRIDHPDDDEVTNKLLQEANFQPRRTLTHMSLDV